MIGYKLKALREAKGYSQEYLAYHCKIEQSTYSRIESGIIRPDLSKLRKLAVVLEIEFSSLISD